MKLSLRLSLSILLAVGGCRGEVATAPTQDHAPMQSNRIAVPAPVRKNLGIEFVRVERRRIAQTLRLSGHFELLPAARHELHTPLPGRITPLVHPLQVVAAGDVVYRIDSPRWRELQRDLGEISTQVQVLQARITALQPLLAAHEEHETSLRDAVAVLEQRARDVTATQESVGGQARELATARAELAQMRASFAEAIEKRAENAALRAELDANLSAGRERLQLALQAAATVLSLTVEDLVRTDAQKPLWRTLGTIDVRAPAAGTVAAVPLANGAWAETGQLVVTIHDLNQVRFAAQALQSDLHRLRDGLPAHVVPASAGRDLAPRVTGTVQLGAHANAAQRTLELFLLPQDLAPWARPGIAGFLEVELAGGAAAELAVPRAATMQDGLERVLFRRNPADGDEVIRIEADLGLDDGHWVEIKSGVREGDEVVLGGAYELMLASSGSAPKGGHFHADGTFHATEDK